jgi:hypothetical protein
MSQRPPIAPALTLLLGALGLAGCFVGPDTSLMVRMPEAGTDAAPGEHLQSDSAEADLSPTDQQPPRDLLSDALAPGDLAPDLPGPDQGSPPLGTDTARVFYGEIGPQLLERSWAFAGDVWSAPFNVAAAKQVLWVTNKVSPATTGDEVAAVLTADTGGLSISALQRNGPVWTESWSHTSSVVTHADKRGFDVAYEASSGDLLFVYSADSATPVYRTRSGGSWSSQQSLPLNDGLGPNPDPNSGTVLWVELVARPGSDEIALLYADDNSALVAMVWSGSAWVTASATTLATNLKENPTSHLVHQRAFDGAYETQTGDLVVAWGVQGQAGFTSAFKPQGSSSWTSVANVALYTGLVEFVDLAGDPASDRIAGVFIDEGNGTERLGLAMWEGSGWVDTKEGDSQIRDVNDQAFGDFPAGVAWVGTTSTAVCVYPDNETGTLDWALWTASAGWMLQADAPIPAKSYTESVALAAVPNQSAVMALVSDSNNKLHSALYSGGSWNVSNGGQPISGQLSSLASLPFSLDFQAQ